MKGYSLSFIIKNPREGTAPGLSVVSKIMEEHKGKTEMESQVGEVTTPQNFGLKLIRHAADYYNVWCELDLC